jgi:putative SOS response-associated peptidase YedK
LRLTFGIPDWVPDQVQRFNVAPSQVVLTIAADKSGAPQLHQMKWGFVPYWEKSPKPAIAPVNARSEEAFNKRMFSHAVQRRRCVIPADGFYEWKRDLTSKQPFDISLTGDRPFFFAGIYEAATELRPETFLLFTTKPNELMATIHDRMPAIIDGDKARQWIAPGPITEDSFVAMTESFPASEMKARPISSLVNSPKNDGPEVLANPEPSPLPAKISRASLSAPEGIQGELF